MHRRPRILAVAAGLALGLALSLTSTAPAQADKPSAAVGQPAPEFALKDTDGKTHKLSDFRGKNVVLQWINPQCPVCKACMKDGIVSRMLSEIKAIDEDVVFLPINSTHWMGPTETAAYLKQYKMNVPGLVDQDGTVGRLYGARTTPHVFVIDAKGILRYDGAIDSYKRGSDAPRENYVVNAIRQIKAGETVSPDKTRSYGCSVKYKKKST